MPATLAKSLHTVTVLVNVARHHMAVVRHMYPDGACPPSAAVQTALILLGYSDASDPYGLAARAVAQLSKEGQS
jgi:hypothetical protein